MSWPETKTKQRQIKLSLLIAGLMLIGFGLVKTQAATGINRQINYQGKLSNSAGVQVADSSWNFRFSLYGAASGGTPIWVERWTSTSTQATTVNGVFSVPLGTITGFATSTVDFSSDNLWLQVDLDADGNGSWEETFAARKRFTATPYSFNTDTIDGIHATSTAAVANYLLALNNVGDLNLFDRGVSSTNATTTVLYLEPKTAAPNGIEGRVYYNDTTNNIMVYNGSTWQTVGSGSAAWEYNSAWNAMTPTSTKGIYVSASSTIAADLKVDGNLTVTGYSTSSNLYSSGVLHVGSTAVFDGSVSGSGFSSSVNTLTNTNISTNWRGQVNGLASLGADGKVPNSQLGPLAISDTFVVGSEVEMLALSAASTGDVAIRTDVNKSYILTSTDPAILSNWEELLSPEDGVISLNGERGVLTIDTDNIPEGYTNLYFTNSRVDERITGSWRGIANGLASLGSDGKVPTSQLPNITLNNTFVVANQAARLALSAAVGDIAVQTDVSKTYILAALPASTNGNWIELLNTAAVTSVNGNIGDVTLTTTNINEGSNKYWTQAKFDAALNATSTWSGDLRVNGNLGVGITASYPLEVVGIASTTDDVYVGKDLYVGNASAAGSARIYFDGSMQNFTWNETGDQFEITNDFHINGNATTTGNFSVGSNYTDSYIYFGGVDAANLWWDSNPGMFNLSNNLSVSGYASTTNGLYTQGAVHIGGALSVDSNSLVTNLNADLLDGQHGSYYSNWDNLTNKAATSTILSLLDSDKRISVLNATTTNVGTLTVYTGSTFNGLTTMSDLRLANGLNASSTSNFLNGLFYGSATTTHTLYVGSYASSTGGLFTQGNGHFGGTLSVDGAVTLSTDLTVANGGTGASTLTGLLQGNGTSAFTAITASTVGQVLRVTGTNTFAFGAVDLDDTDAVTGTLAVANGGTNLSTIAVGQILYGSGAGTFAGLTSPAAANYVLRSSAADTFAWGALVDADIPDTITASNYVPLTWPGYSDGRITTINATTTNVGTLTVYTGSTFNGLTTMSDLRLANGLNASSTSNFLNGLFYGSATTTHTLYVGSYASSTGGLFTQGNGHFGGTLSVDGAVTLSTDLTVANGGTGVGTLTDGGVLLGSGTGAITAMAVLADGEMIVGDGTTDPVAESGATLRTSIGVGTGDTPQFTGVEIGAAADTTLLRVSAGVASIEGKNIYLAGGTDVAMADGGTGASLTDPAADRIMFWDDSASAVTWLTPGTNISISTTNLNVTDAWYNAIGDISLASANIIVGNVSGAAAAVAMSGNATISNTGAVTVNDLTCTDCINATEIEDIYVLTAGDTMTGGLTVGDAVTDEFVVADDDPLFNGLVANAGYGSGLYFLCWNSSTKAMSAQASGCTGGNPATPLLTRAQDGTIQKIMVNLNQIYGTYYQRLENYNFDSDFTFTLTNPDPEIEYFDQMVLEMRCHTGEEVKTQRLYPIHSSEFGINELNTEDKVYLKLTTGQSVNFTFDQPKIEDAAGCSQVDFFLQSKGYYYKGGGDTLITIPDDIAEIVVQDAPTNDPEVTVIDNPDLDIQTLAVQQTATFYGTITIIGEANFEHTVVFKKDVEIDGKLYLSEDQAGTATIAAGATSTEIIFGGEYEGVPKVIANISDDDQSTFVGWKITRKHAGGFTILLQNSIDKNISFDWIALSVKETNIATPVIESITANRKSATSGETVKFEVQATDPDSTNLTYTWSFEGVDAGELEGRVVNWTAANVDFETTVSVYVTVSDGKHEAIGSDLVLVLPSASSEPTPPVVADEPPEEPAAEATTTPEVVIVSGCTDLTAENYNSKATVDDGSCFYPEPVAQEEPSDTIPIETSTTP